MRSAPSAEQSDKRGVRIGATITGAASSAPRRAVRREKPFVSRARRNRLTSLSSA